MREQEFAWEPFGPAMVARVRASLDSSGQIRDWEYGVWSNPHATRPGPAGSMVAGQHVEHAFPIPPPRILPQPEGGGDRNAIPLYSLPQAKVVHHFLPTMPVRVSALRSLGAHMNVFAIESFIDELALRAGADPVEFRLRHLQDPRARDVITTAAERFGWSGRRHGGNRSEEHTSELQSPCNLVCRLLLEKKNKLRCILPRCASSTRAARLRASGARTTCRSSVRSNPGLGLPAPPPADPSVEGRWHGGRGG